MDSDTLVTTTPSVFELVAMASQARPFSADPNEDTYERVCATEHLSVMGAPDGMAIYSLHVDLTFVMPANPFLQSHFDRAYTQFALAQRRGGIQARCIDVSINPVLERRFEDRQREMEDRGASLQEIFVFSGGTLDKLRATLTEGHGMATPESRPAFSSAYGHGVYTSIFADDAIQASGATRAIVLSLAMTGAHTQYEADTSDSWSPRHGWRVFRNADQLLPMAIITY